MSWTVIVYHRREDHEDWDQPNATFAHEEDWSPWCKFCHPKPTTEEELAESLQRAFAAVAGLVVIKPDSEAQWQDAIS